MKILKRLLIIPIFIIALFIMTIPYSLLAILYGLDTANTVMNKVMYPIITFTN